MLKKLCIFTEYWEILYFIKYVKIYISLCGILWIFGILSWEGRHGYRLWFSQRNYRLLSIWFFSLFSLDYERASRIKSFHTLPSNFWAVFSYTLFISDTLQIPSYNLSISSSSFPFSCLRNYNSSCSFSSNRNWVSNGIKWSLWNTLSYKSG